MERSNPFSVLHRLLQTLIRERELHPPSLAVVLCVACFVGFARMELELLILGRPVSNVASLVNNVAFYLHVTYLFGLLAARVTGKALESVLGIVLVGVFLGLLPPVLDVFSLGLSSGRYTYVDGGFASWKWTLLDPAHFSLGESITLWLVVLLMTIYVAEVTRSVARTAAAAIGAYAIVMFIAMVPNSLVRAMLPMNSGATSAQQLGLLSALQLVAAQAAYLVARRPLLRRVFFRMPHAFPFVTLVFLGSAVSARYSALAVAPPARLALTTVLALCIVQLCVAAIVQNDAFDAAEDRGRKIEDVTREDAYFFTAIAALLVLAALPVSALVAAPLAIFLATAIAYSFPFFRAKRCFPINYSCEGVWAWSSFVLGASVTPLVLNRMKPSVEFLVASLLVFGGFFAFNAFKDYKDIRADHRARNQTFYVLALVRGLRLRPLHRGLSVVFLIALLIPPALLLVTGGASVSTVVVSVATIPIVARALLGPPRGSSVRAFLWGVTVYLVALTGSIELSRGVT